MLHRNPFNNLSYRSSKTDGDDDIGVHLPMNSSFEAAASQDDETHDYPRISGRELYAIKKQDRRTPKGRGGAKKKCTNLKDAPSQSASVSKDDGCTDESEQVEVEDESHGQDKQESGTARNRDSESELSGMSDSDDLAAIATRLNRGEGLEEPSESMLDDYFTAHTGVAGPTSDHTLSRLSRPRLDQEAVQTALEVAPNAFQDDCLSLRREYRDLYPYWLFQMSHGYNVLLYGLGSKRQLMEDFCTEHLSEAAHLVVNGYFPGLTMKHVLSKLSSDLLQSSATFKSLSEQAHFICRALEDQGSNAPEELFLVVHNVDGPMLRGDKAQTALSIVAQCAHVHVIASIDHINAPLIWDQNKLSRFNWIWHDVTTYEPYKEETSYENSLLVRQSGTLVLSSLTHVTKSLTPNARGIFELLVKYHLEHSDDQACLGLSFRDLYLKCREKFLVNSDLTLKAQLTEFRDHKLVCSRQGGDGVEYLYVNIDDATLTQYLQQQAEQET